MSESQSDRLPRALIEAAETAGARLRVGFPRWLRPFVMRGVVGITLGRTVYLLPDFVRDPAANVERLVRHELVHVRQMNRLTLPLFLTRYAGEFVYYLLLERSIDRAYRRISLEVEAFSHELEVDRAHGREADRSL